MKKCCKESRAERNVLHTVNVRKANRMGHIVRRNSILKHVIEGKIEVRTAVAGRQWRRRKQLRDDRKERKGYWELKEEALDRTL